MARFIGGHNIINVAGAAIAVRADRMALTRGTAIDEAPLKGTIRAIEYQGTHVQLSLHSEEAPDLFAIVPDERFRLEPMETGEAVGIAWAAADAHPIAPST